MLIALAGILLLRAAQATRPALLRAQAAGSDEGFPQASSKVADVVGDYASVPVDPDRARTSPPIVLTVRESRRYPDRQSGNLDLSRRGVWFSARPAVQSSHRRPSWTVFAAAPSLGDFLGSDLEFDPSAGTLLWAGEVYTAASATTATSLQPAVPLCFDATRPPPDFLPGAWVDRPLSSLHGYGQSANYNIWAQQACYAEYTVHSCFFLNDTARATRAARRIWQPDSCALLPFDSEAFIDKLQGRLLYFVGDSISTQMYVSLMCLLRGQETSTKGLRWVDASQTWNRKSNCPNGAEHCYFGNNQPEAKADCVKFRRKVQICLARVVDYDTLPEKTIVLVNYGLHMLPVYKPSNAALFALVSSIISSARQARKEHRDLRIVWRQVSLQHFDSSDCSFENVVSNYRCSDRACDYSASARTERDTKVLKMLIDSEVVDTLFIQGYEKTSQANVRILRRADTPESVDDCTHYCLPGMPDHWNRLFFNYLMSLSL
jgi:hypothetical protein